MGEKKYAANHLDRQTHCQCVTCLSVLIQVATPSLCSTNELWQAQFLEKRSLNDFFFFSTVLITAPSHCEHEESLHLLNPYCGINGHTSWFSRMAVPSGHM